MDSENYEFIREIEVEYGNVELKLVQHSVGDVGCVVWDAGIVMGKYLDYQQKFVNSMSGKMVVDIGSGTGVAGLFAAALGAKVILTDLPEIIPILEKNIQSNCKALKGSVSAAVLKWGEVDTKFLVPDLILVSDCVYYDMSVEKLIPTLEELAGSHTEILISYEDRELGNKRELLKGFLNKLRSSFEIDIIPQSEQHPDYQSPDIHLLKCTKK
ncbi:protein N-lysine methyltransferase METTL21D [Parasteatoda tepidariorum]|nr:protein-lysine methyltransferase METTL21D [Parasteatoda tepidariorum]